MGNRLPKVMEDQFRSMTRTGVIIPSLSHYARYDLMEVERPFSKSFQIS